MRLASFNSPLLTACLIVLAGFAAYSNSFSGPLIFDDHWAIRENPSLHRLWPLGQVLSPPRDGQTVSGRPLLNLSLAINYALGGEQTWGYHAVNLAIHLLNGLLLWGILRCTFRLPALSPRMGGAAEGLALAIALLWTLHPLQTESVTYIVQRAESLAGLFYLLVVYSVIRGAQAKREALWYSLAVGACFLGVATKEIVATAPVVVLLYDRAFLAGSFREALRRRWQLYAGLGVSWGVVVGLVASTSGWRGTLDRETFDVWSYARTQPAVVLHYLRLSFWPHPLCLNYDWPVANTIRAVLPGMLLIGLLGAATIAGVIGRRAWGFLGAWFFLILMPTSSLLPLKQMAFEHRMYLSLAAVVTLVVAGLYLAGREVVRRGWLAGRTMTVAGLCLFTLVAVVLGVLTFRRNEAYRSELSIWQDTVTKAPHNAGARRNLGAALVADGRPLAAADLYEQGLKLQPDDAEFHHLLAGVLGAAGRAEEAADHCGQALRINPDYLEAHVELGNQLLALRRPEESLKHYGQASRIRPAAAAYIGMGNALTALGRQSEAVGYFERALAVAPTNAAARNNLGNALNELERIQEAIEQFEEAVRITPDYFEAHNNLAAALTRIGRVTPAVEHYQEALRLRPDSPQVHFNLALILSQSNRTAEAIEHYQQAVRIDPGFVQARLNLIVALERAGRTHEAIEVGRKTLHLVTDRPQPLLFLAWLMATHVPTEGGDPAEAVRLAQRGRDMLGQPDVTCLDTLAAAYASAGRFDTAVDAARQAWVLAQSSGKTSEAQEIHMRMQLYRDQKPYRQ